MSNEGLYQVEMASLNWENSMGSAQQVQAQTVDLQASKLMSIYKAAGSALSYLMKTGSSANHQKPASSSSSEYPTQVQVWQAYYNEQSQEWQNCENQWNSGVQSGDQQLQTLGTDTQQAVNLVQTAGKHLSDIAALLQQPL